MPLGARLAVMILLAAVPVFVIQIFQLLDEREARRQSILEGAQTVASQIAARGDRLVTSARFLLTAVTRLTAVRNADAEACHLELRAIARELPEIVGLAVLEPDGSALCSTSGPRRPINVGDREYFKETLRSRSFQASGYIVGRVTGRGSMVFTYPVVRDDEVMLVALAAISTDAFSATLADPSLPAGAFVMLLDDKGRVLARWPEPEQWVGRDLSGTGWVRPPSAPTRAARRVTLEGEKQVEYALGYARVQEPSAATAIVALPVAPALAEADALFRRSISLTVMVFLAAIAVAWVGAIYAVRRPIRQLSEQIDAIARGEEKPPVASGLPELRQLSEHFHRLSRSLAARQAELTAALQQKDMLLREVNHRVKNSLQLIASLFSLQRSRIRDDEVRHHFEDAMHRVYTVGRVHQRLYQDQQFDSLQFDRLLAELCEELSQALRRGPGPELECRASDLRLATDKAIPLGLIVNELVTNAFKYAYPDGSTGSIRVECRKEGDELALEVFDAGGPLPEGFDPERSEGLGMKVIMALVRQLNGTIEVVPRPVGKSFIVRCTI